MNTYVEKDGVRREVKNLGWLLRNWKDVDGFAVLAGNQVANGALLVAKLKSGGNYVSTFASFSVLLDFLDRPVFRGLRCVVSYARPDGGPKKVGAFDVGDKKASAWIYNKVRSVQRGGNVVLNGLRGLFGLGGEVDQSRGRIWAQRVYDERMASGNLPNLGRGFSKEQRAWRAVQSIAMRKLYVNGSPFGENRYLPMPEHQRAFWRGALELANQRLVALDQPPQGFLGGCNCTGKGLGGTRRDDGGREFSGVYINDEVSIVTPRPTGYGDNDGDGPYIPGLPEALQRLGVRAAIVDGIKGQVLRTAGGPLFIYATRTGIYGQFIDPQRAYERFWNDFDYKGRVKYRMDVGRVEIVGLGGSREIKARDVNEFMLWACEAARQR